MLNYDNGILRVPFNKQTKRYSSYESLHSDLAARIMDRIIAKDIPDIRYSTRKAVFDVEIVDPNGDYHVPDCPEYAMLQYFSGLLGINNISKFFIESHKIDKKNRNTENIDNLNLILKSIFDGKKKSEKVICHNVYDLYSKDGQGRTFASEDYEYFEDIEYLEITQKFADEYGLIFAGGEGPSGYTYSAVVDIYDASTDSWSTDTLPGGVRSPRKGGRFRWPRLPGPPAFRRWSRPAR